jgi:hypothetical protein
MTTDDAPQATTNVVTNYLANKDHCYLITL